MSRDDREIPVDSVLGIAPIFYSSESFFQLVDLLLSMSEVVFIMRLQPSGPRLELF